MPLLPQMQQINHLLQAFIHAEERNTAEAIFLTSEEEARQVWRALRGGALTALRGDKPKDHLALYLKAAGLVLYTVLDQKSGARFDKIAHFYGQATTPSERQNCADRLIGIAERGLRSTRRASLQNMRCLQTAIDALKPPAWSGVDMRRKNWSDVTLQSHGFYLVTGAENAVLPGPIEGPCVVGILPEKKPARAYFKWPGGKGRLASAVLGQLLLDSAEIYVEPFFGGGSVFLQSAFCGPAFLSDVNPRIVALHRAVQQDPQGVYQALRDLPWGPAWKDAYKKRRYTLNETAPEATPAFAADMLWVAAGAYNGLWRENASGGMNSPAGAYDNIKPPPMERLLDAAEALRGASLRCHDFRIALLAVAQLSPETRVSIYVDSPYVPVSPSASFTSYSAGGFSEQDQVDLAHALAYIVRRGRVRVVASNADVPFIRNLYGYLGFSLREIQVRRSIAARGSSRILAKELIMAAGDHLQPG